MLNFIVEHAALFFLVFARAIAVVLTVPLFSTRAVPSVAKVALALFMAFLIFPRAYAGSFESAYGRYGAFSLDYLPLLAGEAMIGVITGFYVSIIFAAFSTAGQFFSFQSGLSMAEAYDALSQVENPLMGQFLNLIAMALFLRVDGFQQLFLQALVRSYEAFNALSLVQARDAFFQFLFSGLTELFFDALMISLPLIGILFLVSVSMGLLTKAAPQMNLLAEGPPLTLAVSFFALMLVLPSICEFFLFSFDAAFTRIERLYIAVSGGLGGTQ